MSIHFDGTDDYLSHSVPSFQLGSTYTMACWVRFNDWSGGFSPVFVRTRASGFMPADILEGITRGFDDLGGGGPSDGTKVHAVTWVNSGSWAVAIGTTATVNDVWYHVAATFRGTWKRSIYLNGTQDGANNTIKTGSYTTVSYGALSRNSGVSHFYHQEIAEPAFWNAELSLGEIAALGAGALPCEVRPDKLVVWNRFLGMPPQGMMGIPTSWTTGDAPTSSPHAPVSEPVPAVG